MCQPIQLPIPAERNSISRATFGCGFLFVALALVCLALLPTAQAQDGDLGQANTGEGLNALLSNTGGFNNTADGYQALYGNTSGGANTATGANALASNNGDYNLANVISFLVIRRTPVRSEQDERNDEKDDTRSDQPWPDDWPKLPPRIANTPTTKHTPVIRMAIGDMSPG